jgi:hypothetical protein
VWEGIGRETLVRRPFQTRTTILNNERS